MNAPGKKSQTTASHLESLKQHFEQLKNQKKIQQQKEQLLRILRQQQ